MIVMQWGCGLQADTWHVEEKRPTQYMRMYLIDGGSAWYEDCTTRQPLVKGRLYLFPAQQAYRMGQQRDDPIRCLWLHADVFPFVSARMMEVRPEKYPDIQKTLYLLRRQILSSAPPKCIEAFCMAFLQLLIREKILSQKIDSALIDPSAISATQSIGALSRKTGYTEEHFIRSFRKTAGVTPYQYILSQRMNEAISLMALGFSMDEIAARTGYASGKSFSGAFKRRFGLSPEAYRDSFLKKA